VLQNGRTVAGDLIAEDAQSVTVDLSDASQLIIRRINKTHIKQIESWGHPSRRGPEYVVLPVQGEIGKDVTADALKAGIATAGRLYPRYLVLYIDSDGGNLAELEKMVAALHAVPSDIETVALVHKAYSAAAVLAMSCPKIYLTPDAVIGAAVPFIRGKDGLPEDVNAKLRSAIEAKWRTWISSVGHNDLLVRGMVEMDLEIYLDTDGDRPKLSTSGPGKLLKSNDQILTLTSNEAVECGLARPGKDFADVGQQLASGPCYESSIRPWDAVIRVARKHKHELIVAEAEARIAPEINAIVHRANILADRVAADNDAIARLSAQQGDAAANAVAPLQADVDSARAEYSRLRSRYDELRATVPEFND
jgi:ATP-dependent protease ClpP protease subunit